MKSSNYMQVIQTDTERRMVTLHTPEMFTGGPCITKHKTKNHQFFFYGSTRAEALRWKKVFLAKCEAEGLNLNGEDTP